METLLDIIFARIPVAQRQQFQKMSTKTDFLKTWLNSHNTKRLFLGYSKKQLEKIAKDYGIKIPGNSSQPAKIVSALESALDGGMMSEGDMKDNIWKNAIISVSCFNVLYLIID